MGYAEGYEAIIIDLPLCGDLTASRLHVGRQCHKFTDRYQR